PSPATSLGGQGVFGFGSGSGRGAAPFLAEPAPWGGALGRGARRREVVGEAARVRFGQARRQRPAPLGVEGVIELFAQRGLERAFAGAVVELHPPRLRAVVVELAFLAPRFGGYPFRGPVGVRR